MRAQEKELTIKYPFRTAMAFNDLTSFIFIFRTFKQENKNLSE